MVVDIGKRELSFANEHFPDKPIFPETVRKTDTITKELKGFTAV